MRRVVTWEGALCRRRTWDSENWSVGFWRRVPTASCGNSPFQCIGFRKKIDSLSDNGFGEALVGSHGVSGSRRRRRD